MPPGAPEEPPGRTPSPHCAPEYKRKSRRGCKWQRRTGRERESQDDMTAIKLAVLSALVATVAAEPPVYHNNDISSSYGVPSNDYGGYSGGGYSGGGFGGGDVAGGFGGEGGYGGGHEQHHHEEHHEAKPYEFGYQVKDHHHGTDFGQQETSDGHNVKGSYRVLLPDGRTQIVTYHADWKTGFHADVKYEGEAHYPEPQQHQQQSGYNYPAPSHQQQSSYNYPAPSHQQQSGYSYPAPSQSDYSGGDLGGQSWGGHSGYKR